ncbi:MAG: nitrophenyl compound nitroreductase subunit ArsF family protein [Thermodesulfovibrionales bacterium]
MKIKRLFSAVLLLFILFSISFLIYREYFQKSHVKKEDAVTELENNKEKPNYATSSQEQSVKDKKVKTGNKVTTKQGDPGAACNFQGTSCDSNNKVIAYYFHGTHRCTTCLTIERYSREAIERYFSKELNDGRLEFRTLNVEEPENQHYIQDYQLYTRSLVLALYKDNKQVVWENLPDIWFYVRDREKFYQYVKDETERFLKGIE